jgi:cytochrome c oxidase subunit 4
MNPSAIIVEPTTPAADDHAHGQGEVHHHAVPLWLLFGVFGALLFFTVLTVGVTYVDLGEFNIWLALGVAVIKATLVALYFMHLRWDSPFNSVIIASAFLFVAIFIGIALVDSHAYQPAIEPPLSLPAK